MTNEPADILVTGATSFVGRNLLSTIAATGANIVATYNRSAPCRNDHENIRFVRIDLTDPDDYNTLPDQVRTIIHLAAASSDQPGARHVADLNIRGMALLLDYARRVGVEQMVFASSITVHGDIVEPVIDETTEIRNPGAYGMSKRIGELMLAEVADDLASVSLRLPAVLGPGAERHWPARVIAAARNDRPVRLYNPTAPFNNVVDVASLAGFTARLTVGGWRGAHVFPICCSGTLSVQAAAKLLLDKAGYRAELAVDPTPAPSYVIDSHAARDFGFKATNIADALAAYAVGESRAADHAV